MSGVAAVRTGSWGTTLAVMLTHRGLSVRPLSRQEATFFLWLRSFGKILSQCDATIFLTILTKLI